MMKINDVRINEEEKFALYVKEEEKKGYRNTVTDVTIDGVSRETKAVEKIANKQ